MKLDGPNQLWVADITYVSIATGFVYLAAILDAWSRRVVGYAISRSIDARLAVAALKAVPRSSSTKSGRGKSSVATSVALLRTSPPLSCKVDAPSEPGTMPVRSNRRRVASAECGADGTVGSRTMETHTRARIRRDVPPDADRRHRQSPGLQRHGVVLPQARLCLPAWL